MNNVLACKLLFHVAYDWVTEKSRREGNVVHQSAPILDVFNFCSFIVVSPVSNMFEGQLEAKTDKL